MIREMLIRAGLKKKEMQTPGKPVSVLPPSESWHFVSSGREVRRGQVLSYRHLSGAVYEVDIAGFSKHQIAIFDGTTPTQELVDRYTTIWDNPAYIEMMRKQEETRKREDEESQIRYKNNYREEQKRLATQYRLERENSSQVFRNAFNIKRLTDGRYEEVNPGGNRHRAGDFFM